MLPGVQPPENVEPSIVININHKRAVASFRHERRGQSFGGGTGRTPSPAATWMLTILPTPICACSMLMRASHGSPACVE
jgi:hypothetical protein